VDKPTESERRLTDSRSVAHSNPIKRLLATLTSLLCLVSATAQTQMPQKDPSVTLHATGNFDVKTTAQDDKSPDPLLGRYALDKQYHGDLEAIGVGQMLTAGTQVKGSGAYVAIEKVAGSLKGRTGSFVLEHMGTMTENVPQLTITIVPDSGTAGLKGIAGKMTITIAAGGKHSYDLEYTLPRGD
jgi:Protein of unknown function (DUF3224)